MSLPQLIQAGLGYVLENPIVQGIQSVQGCLPERATEKISEILKAHFTFSAKEISQAYQSSYAYALAAISTGLATPEQRQSFLQKIIHSKVKREFADQIETLYLQPFASQRNIRGEFLDKFRSQTIEICGLLSKQKGVLFEFDEDYLGNLATDKSAFAITAFVLSHLQETPKTRAYLNEVAVAFFTHKELLGNAILFFFKEQLRTEPRVEATLAALQREHLWVNLRDMKSAQETLTQNLEEKQAEILRIDVASHAHRRFF